MFHPVIDTDEHFIINPVTMEIENMSGKTKLMQGDHNSERYTFELTPKNIDGHPMFACNTIEVHYDNIKSDKTETNHGVYVVEDMVSENDTITFSWLISREATKYDGTLEFSIRFACVDKLDIENPTAVYEKFTDIYKGITIAKGKYNSPVIVDPYPDVLTKIKNDVLIAIGNAYPPAEGATF